MSRQKENWVGSDSGVRTRFRPTLNLHKRVAVDKVLWRASHFYERHVCFDISPPAAPRGWWTLFMDEGWWEMEVTQSETAVWLPRSIMVIGAAEGTAAQDAGSRKPSGSVGIDDVQTRVAEMGGKAELVLRIPDAKLRFRAPAGRKLHTKLDTTILIIKCPQNH